MPEPLPRQSSVGPPATITRWACPECEIARISGNKPPFMCHGPIGAPHSPSAAWQPVTYFLLPDDAEERIARALTRFNGDSPDDDWHAYSGDALAVIAALAGEDDDVR